MPRTIWKDCRARGTLSLNTHAHTHARFHMISSRLSADLSSSVCNECFLIAIIFVPLVFFYQHSELITFILILVRRMPSKTEKSNCAICHCPIRSSEAVRLSSTHTKHCKHDFWSGERSAVVFVAHSVDIVNTNLFENLLQVIGQSHSGCD